MACAFWSFAVHSVCNYAGLPDPEWLQNQGTARLVGCDSTFECMCMSLHSVAHAGCMQKKGNIAWLSANPFFNHRSLHKACLVINAGHVTCVSRCRQNVCLEAAKHRLESDQVRQQLALQQSQSGPTNVDANIVILQCCWQMLPLRLVRLFNQGAH